MELSVWKRRGKTGRLSSCTNIELKYGYRVHYCGVAVSKLERQIILLAVEGKRSSLMTEDVTTGTHVVTRQH